MNVKLIIPMLLLSLNVACTGSTGGTDSSQSCNGASCDGGRTIGEASSEEVNDNDADASDQSLANEDANEPSIVLEPIVAQSSVTGIAAKNYLQLNNTLHTLTNIPTNHPNILSEYEAIIMQLPSTSNIESLNGFNQIAQTRLAFAYCNEYMEENIDQYSALEDDEAIQLLLDNMVDVDVINNPSHADLYQNLIAIMNDTDMLIDDNDDASKRTKLFKMSCTALLASSYVSMI